MSECTPERRILNKSERIKIHEYLRESASHKIRAEPGHRNMRSTIPYQFETRTAYMATGKNDLIVIDKAIHLPLTPRGKTERKIADYGEVQESHN